MSYNMPKIFRKCFLYRYLLIIRVRSLTTDQLKDKLLKRTHILDKANLDNIQDQTKTQEVEVHLNEAIRRGFKPGQAIKWAWQVLYQAYFNQEIDEETEPEIKIESNEQQGLATLIKTRRSVRFWKNQSVDPNQISKLIDTAKWAPSSCHRQPWSFLILSKSVDIEFMKKLTNQDFFTKSSLVIVSMVDMNKYLNESKSYAFLDMGIIIQNLLLLLHNQGLGACCMGIHLDKKNQPAINEFHKRFSVKSSLYPVVFIPVGHPDKQVKAPLRKETSEIVRIVK